MQVLLAAMLINADHAALEDGEIALNAVGRGAVLLRVLFLAMVDRAVRREAPAEWKRMVRGGRSVRRL